MDLLDVVRGIENGDYSPDGFIAVIPAMVQMQHRSLPEVLAYVLVKHLFTRWGYSNPWTYFDALGVPLSVRRQAITIALESAACSPAWAKAAGPKAVAMIHGLSASFPAMMSDQKFDSWIQAIATAAR